VHQSSIQSSGYRFLKQGEKVKFDISGSERGRAAVNVSDPEGKPFNRTRDDAMAAKPPRKTPAEGGAPAPAAAKPAPAAAAAPAGDKPARAPRAAKPAAAAAPKTA
jgi:hypothetical protein